jgi:hypothetical protein
VRMEARAIARSVEGGKLLAVMVLYVGFPLGRGRGCVGVEAIVVASVLSWCWVVLREGESSSIVFLTSFMLLYTPSAASSIRMAVALREARVDALLACGVSVFVRAMDDDVRASEVAWIVAIWGDIASMI